MPIGEIVASHPEAGELLFQYGLHCVGCHGSQYETLEEGASMHGLSKEDIQLLVKDLNVLLKAKTYKKKGMIFTERFVQALQEVQPTSKKKQGLQIEMVIHKNKEQEYVFEWIQEPLSFHTTIMLEDIPLFVAKDDIVHLKGAMFDYKAGEFFVIPA